MTKKMDPDIYEANIKKLEVVNYLDILDFKEGTL